MFLKLWLYWRLPIRPPTRHIFTLVLENCEKSALKHSTEKPMVTLLVKAYLAPYQRSMVETLYENR